MIMNHALITIMPIAFVLTLVLTYAIRYFALNNNFLDVPNTRSAHNTATPHSGGLSIVIVFLVTIGLDGLLPTYMVYAIIGAGTLVSMIGLLDDIREVSAKWRILIHFFAVSLLCFYLNDGTREFNFIGVNLHASLIGLFIIVFLLVWMINLFNFMDGIDGFAASETIFISCAAAYFSWLLNIDYLVNICLILASSTFGFLILNWSPAKIFMGDVSSGFLGLILGIIAYEYILEGGIAWTWVILMGVFIVDATLTLFVRIAHKEKMYEAHDTHAYQQAAKLLGHRNVTLILIAINLLWLFPLATVSFFYPNIAIWLAIIALSPLIMIVLMFNSEKFFKIKAKV